MAQVERNSTGVNRVVLLERAAVVPIVFTVVMRVISMMCVLRSRSR